MRDLCRFDSCDVTDGGSLVTSFKQCKPDIVFHLAGYGIHRSDRDVDSALSTNVLGSMRVVEAAARAGSGLVVHVGSSLEYGSSEHGLREDDVLKPFGVYGATKAAGLLASRHRAQELKLRWLGIRPFTTYGPGERVTKLVPYVITQVLKGLPVRTTPGRQRRDFLYVSDLVDAVSTLADSAVPDGEVVNVGSGVPVALCEVIAELKNQLPAGTYEVGARPAEAGEPMCQYADLTKLRRYRPGWTPSVSLAEGLQRTIAHYREGGPT